MGGRVFLGHSVIIKWTWGVSQNLQFDPPFDPPTIRHKGVTWCWTYLSGWFLFDQNSCFQSWKLHFFSEFLLLTNSLIKGDEGGIFSKTPDWKTLFLLKMKIKENPGCSNKE